MGMCSFVINDTAYIIGGRTTSIQAISEIWAYSFPADTWTFKGDFPFGGRWRASATSDSTKGYLIFGKDETNNYRKELYEYIPATNSWDQLNSFPAYGRIYASMKILSDNLFVIAGLDSTSASHNDMWQYKLASSSWQQLSSIPDIERRGGMCFNNSNTLYYCAGIDQTNTRLRETWRIFNPTSVFEAEQFNSFTIYPNPSSGNIVIHASSNLEIENIRIQNLIGEVVKSFNSKIYLTNNDQVDIDISQLPNGIYFIALNSQNSVSIKKLVKN
jgi:hypothetical protein